MIQATTTTPNASPSSNKDVVAQKKRRKRPNKKKQPMTVQMDHRANPPLHLDKKKDIADDKNMHANSQNKDSTKSVHGRSSTRFNKKKKKKKKNNKQCPSSAFSQVDAHDYIHHVNETTIINHTSTNNHTTTDNNKHGSQEEFKTTTCTSFSSSCASSLNQLTASGRDMSLIHHDGQVKMLQLVSETKNRVLSLLKQQECDKREEKYQMLCEETCDHLKKVNSEIELLIGFRKSFELEMKKLESMIHHLSQTNLNTLKEKFDKEEYRVLIHALPIYSKRHEILQQLEQNDVIICSCSTATGKSTQIPQYLYEAGYTNIVCTQPRKVSAFSLAQRVSEEMNPTMIDHHTTTHIRNIPQQEQSYHHSRKDVWIGYQTSPVNKTNKHISSKWTSHSMSSIVFVTDRILLNEYQKDSLLSSYEVVMIDEIHERSTYTDILISLLKLCVKKRKLLQRPLKVILSSATLQVELFSKSVQW